MMAISKSPEGRNLGVMALIFAICALYATAEIALGPSRPIMEIDSASFLDFSPVRIGGYPAFLWLFGSHGALYVQPIAYAGALCWLGIETFKFTKSPILTALLLFALMANPALNKWHARIMAESLSLTLLICMLASTVRQVRVQDTLSVMAGSMAVGLATIVKQSGICFLFPPAGALLLSAPRPNRAGKWLVLILPILLIIFSERIISGLAHGEAEFNSQLSQRIFVLGALVDASQDESAVVDFAGVRQLLKEAPTTDIAQSLVVDYASCMQHFCQPQAPMDNASKLGVGLRRLAAAPLQFASLIWLQYRALWAFYSKTDPTSPPLYADFIAAHRPLPFDNLILSAGATSAAEAYSQFATLIRPAFIGFAVLSGAIILIGFGAYYRKHMDGALMIAFLSAVSLHATLLFTAIFGGGIPRYTIAVIPALVVSFVFFGFWLWETFARRNAAKP